MSRRPRLSLLSAIRMADMSSLFLPWVLALVTLGGCTTAGRLTPIARGESVAVVVVAGPGDAAPVEIRNRSLRDDMAVGAGSGAVAGGLWGLSCGPWAPLCVPLGSALGVMYGTAGGAAVGLTGVLASDKASALRQRLSEARTARDIVSEMHDNIGERARLRWILNADRPTIELHVELTTIVLNTTRDEQVNMVVKTLVTLRRSDGKRLIGNDTKQYDYVGPYSTLDAWLDRGTDFVDTSLSNASRQLAAQIVSELAANSPESPPMAPN